MKFHAFRAMRAIAAGYRILAPIIGLSLNLAGYLIARLLLATGR